MKTSMTDGHILGGPDVSTQGEFIIIYMVFGRPHHYSHGFGLQVILANISFSSGCFSGID